MRVRATIAYDGTRYHGFQRQSAEREPTIQGEVERALEKLTGQALTVLGAGRTDAGVHASGQVIAFDAPWSHPVADLQRALNAVLPDAIVVLEALESPADFHPRYQARSREYRYTLYNAPLRHPLHRLYALHVSEPLDVERMHAAARRLIGEHDFAAFGQATTGESTVRRMVRAEVGQAAPWMTIDLEANGFLYRMVRSIVGALIAVGRGKLTVERFAEILESRDRAQAEATVAPHGLCLMRVNY
ncbi:MAG TPA: tRNA pseudouridine(38-40) synthase TruA [Anaerolineae bacterium]|nr:tRNA pseudouridine(38-40) synthase TruA [Anaerolineae bacterium]